MPATLLGTTSAERLDILGTQETGNDVRHVAILATKTPLKRGDLSPVLHMAPPLDFSGTVVAHVHAAFSLSVQEREAIELWIALMRPRTAACTYLALPSVERQKDEASNRTFACKCSCAGFVLAAYLDGGGISLIDESLLPEVSKETIVRLWFPRSRPDVVNRKLESAGLKGEGPWRVLLPGYLFHAGELDRGKLPHSPKAAELSFPAKTASTASSGTGSL